MRTVLDHIAQHAASDVRTIRSCLSVFLPGVKVHARCGKLVYVTWRKSIIPALGLRFGSSLYERIYVRWVMWKHGCQ